jgi:hypothetical protein
MHDLRLLDDAQYLANMGRPPPEVCHELMMTLYPAAGKT